MTDKHLLAEHLHRLERQAAATAALIDFTDAELLQQIADAWAPGNSRTQRVWLDWLRECGDRWQQPTAAGGLRGF
jgi:hypothetical protein